MYSKSHLSPRLCFAFLVVGLVGCGSPEKDSDSPSKREVALAQKFERPPLLATLTKGGQEITFVGLHAKPDRALEEASLLNDLIEVAYSLGYSKRTLVMGDLNLGCSYAKSSSVASLSILSVFKMLISSDADTTTGNSHCAYDRALANLSASAVVLESSVDAYSDHHAIMANVEGFGTVCAWNSQRLSKDKVAARPEIKGAAKSLIGSCGVTFLQEIIDGEAAVSLAEAAGAPIQLSSRMGSTSYKECYGLVERGAEVSNFRILGTEPGEGFCAKDAVWKVEPKKKDGGASDRSSTKPSGDCGRNPYRTPRGYCFATKGGRKVRVANACCN